MAVNYVKGEDNAPSLLPRMATEKEQVVQAIRLTGLMVGAS